MSKHAADVQLLKGKEDIIPRIYIFYGWVIINYQLLTREAKTQHAAG